MPVNATVLEAVDSFSHKRKCDDHNLYSSDQQYKMAVYAVENKVTSVARHFINVLEKNVNESNVRTIKRAYLVKKSTNDDFGVDLPKVRTIKKTYLVKKSTMYTNDEFSGDLV